MTAWRVFKKEKHRKRFTITGKDHMGITRQVPAYTREDLSYDLARNLGTLVEYRQQNMSVPPMLATWLDGLAPETKRRLCSWGLLDAQARPVEEHLADFEAHLTVKGNTAKYIRQTIFRIQAIVTGCKVVHWSDVQGSRVQQFIATIRSSKQRLASAQTQNYYLRDFKAFCRWAVADAEVFQAGRGRENRDCPGRLYEEPPDGGAAASRGHGPGAQASLCEQAAGREGVQHPLGAGPR